MATTPVAMYAAKLRGKGCWEIARVGDMRAA
jgi:hypothetical protein